MGLGDFVERYRYLVFLLWGFGAFNFFYTINNIFGNPFGLPLRIAIPTLFIEGPLIINYIDWFPWAIMFSIIFIVITIGWLVDAI